MIILVTIVHFTKFHIDLVLTNTTTIETLQIKAGKITVSTDPKMVTDRLCSITSESTTIGCRCLEGTTGIGLYPCSRKTRDLLETASSGPEKPNQLFQSDSFSTHIYISILSCSKLLPRLRTSGAQQSASLWGRDHTAHTIGYIHKYDTCRFNVWLALHPALQTQTDCHP